MFLGSASDEFSRDFFDIPRDILSEADRPSRVLNLGPAGASDLGGLSLCVCVCVCV